VSEVLIEVSVRMYHGEEKENWDVSQCPWIFILGCEAKRRYIKVSFYER